MRLGSFTSLRHFNPKQLKIGTGHNLSTQLGGPVSCSKAQQWLIQSWDLNLRAVRTLAAEPSYHLLMKSL